LRLTYLLAPLVALAALGSAFALAAPASAQTPTATATSTATATPTATPTVAPCPSGVTLTLSPPAASAPTTVTASVSPAGLNIKAGSAGDPTSFHLHYFIDTPAVAAGAPIPLGDAKIIHSGTTTQDLGSLAPGQHTATVVLGQFTHVACDTRASVTFTVAQAATPTTGATVVSPAAPKTGGAGMLDSGRNAWLVLGIALTALGVVAGARVAAGRAR
jgi:hypothetical protein